VHGARWAVSSFNQIYYNCSLESFVGLHQNPHP
jgi:hypothetical protein